MKRVIFLFFLTVFTVSAGLLFWSCQHGTSSAGVKDEPESDVKYAEEFWGEWIRIDTGDTWYISGNSISINGSPVSIEPTLARQSAQVISLNEGGRTSYLFASRTANATLRGKVILVDDPAANEVSAGLSRAVSMESLSVEISNLNQPEQEPVRVETDPATGEFTAPGLIPGDELEVTVVGTGGAIPVPGLPIPPDDPEYAPPVVPIPISSGVNLKASIRPADESVDTTLMYANGLSMEFLLEVENIGNDDCSAATYELEWDDTYLAVNDPAPNRRLGTLTPKEQGGSTYKKTIQLTITPKPLSGNLAFIDAKIGVRINDPIVRKTWNDSVSIRYNRAKIPFRFRSEYPVQGIIKVPGGKTHHFRTDGSSYGNYTYNIELPWSTEDYFIIFSGATAETEAAYSLGINTAPSGDFITFSDTGIYEPNDGEGQAFLIENSDSIMAYLHGGSRTDIDYYRINMGNEVPVIKLVPLETYAFLENGGNGDGTINPGESAYLDFVVKNETNQSRSVTVSLSAEGANAGYVTINKWSASTPAIRPNYYASLTDSADSPTDDAGLFVTDRISQALEVSVSPECPASVSIPFVLSFTDSLGISWTETVSLAVLEPDRTVAITVPAAGNCVLTGRTGNGDSYVQPGESFYYDITVKNSGDRSVPGLQGALSSTASGGNVTIVTASADLGTLGAGASRTARYEFTVNESCPPGTEIAFTLTLTSQNGRVWWDSPSSVTVNARGRVTFDADGGSPATQTKTAGLDGTIGSSNMPPEPTRNEYAFGGWYTERNGGGSQFSASTPVSADITVYAKWMLISYTVTFDADGGNPATQMLVIESGGTVGFSNMPAEPAKSGYTFGGWYTERDGGSTQFSASTPVTATITVYAKWTCTVTFNADGGSPATQTRTVNSGGAVGTSNMPAEPIRSGNTFGGWYTATGGNGTQVTASTSVTATITVYAKWTCMVTFNADGGNPATQTRTMVSGGAMGAANMPDEPTRSEYAFGGWYTAQNGGGAQFTASTPVSADITVYAKWNNTVTFDAGSGSPATQTRTVNSGGTVGASNMPDEPTRSGYAFGGWYTARNGSGGKFTASTAVSANITVYAAWTVVYTITFNADGGSPATQSRTVNSGGMVGSSNMPSEPARSGNTFGGWYTATGGNGTQFTASTPVTATITVYAKWTCTVTFNTDGGSPATQTRTVNSSGMVGSSNMPSEPARSGNTFGGWYTATGGNGTQFTAFTTVTGNITVYAKWTCTVTFNADEGSPATQTRTMVSGGAMGAANMPNEPTRNEYAFGGWYTARNGGGSQFTDSTSVTGNITVYAKWMPAVSVPSGPSLEESLTWISNNAVEGNVYIITLKNDETIAPRTLSYNSKNVSIILAGGAYERTVSLSANGSMFTVGSGVTLTLGSNVTLRGRSSNTASLVKVNNGGALVMNDGSKISGNTAASSDGGVYVSGTFTMNGGKISGNTASSGGGVYVSSGTFTMNGGEISGNTTSSSFGGGVVVNDTFTMNGGEISGNTASSFGGGVVVGSNGTFTMEDGEISGNTASSAGGGVYIFGTFTMNGGEISGNTAYSGGGGVNVSGKFTMSGGEISGNTAYYGGGVDAFSGTFTKQPGGIIYGSNASAALKNTATYGDSSYGHAVYVDYSKKRNTTAGIGVTLDSSKTGAAGGWE